MTRGKLPDTKSKKVSEINGATANRYSTRMSMQNSSKNVSKKKKKFGACLFIVKGWDYTKCLSHPA